MKKLVFALILGLGLVSLSACSVPGRTNFGAGSVQAPVSNNKTDDTSSVFTDGAYQIDAASSALSWEASKVVATHTGTVRVKSGSVQVSGGALAGATVVMDMSSIASDQGIEALVTHLKNADFFDAANYPEARLVITSVNPGANEGEYALTGDLTIKNVTAPITFTAKVKTSGNELEAQSQLSIDRTKWGIKYGSGQFFKDLGDNMIGDDIKFSVLIKATRQL